MRYLFILLFPIFLFSQVTISAPRSFVIGEPVVFSISASGSNVNFPTINKIDVYAVQNAGTSSQTTIINYVTKHSITRKFIFYPKKDITIPSFDINIDGKIEKTQIKQIKASKVKKTNSSLFDLSMNLGKTTAFVGEAVVLRINFKYKENLQIFDLKYDNVNFDNFWSKQLKSSNPIHQNGYVTQELKYLLFPQKSGLLEISPIKITVVLADLSATNSIFGPPTKQINVYSNSVKIDVKALPNGVSLIGDFNINASVDKTTIKEGEAVSYTLSINGRGNIDDIEEIKLDIPNATIYDNKAIKEYNIQNRTYGGTYKKVYSIVAQNDFVIKPIELKFFNKKTNSVNTVFTKEYKIKVINAPKHKSTLEISKDTEKPSLIKEKIVTKIVKTSNQDKILFFVFGLIVAFIIVGIYILYKRKDIKVEEINIEKSIKKVKTKQELFKIIVPFINIDENLDKIIYSIESNEQNIDMKKIKKELIDIIKELKL